MITLKTKPLTTAEALWLKKMNTLLSKCPSGRLEGYTIGDSYVAIFDGSRLDEINELIDENIGQTDFCQACEELDASLSILKFPFPVHSTAG